MADIKDRAREYIAEHSEYSEVFGQTFVAVDTLTAMVEFAEQETKKLEAEKDKAWWEGFDTCKAKAGEANVKLSDEINLLKAQIEKMKEVILELLNFEGNLDPYMYECDSAQNGELLKPFTNAREFLKDCICKKCKGEGIVRVGYNGWDKNPCPICKGRGYVIRSN